MTAVRTISKDQLPALLRGQRAPLWWSFWLLIVIETTVFATFISSYFYLRFHAAEWPPPGLPQPSLVLPLVNTGVLLASSIAVLVASSGIKKGNVRRLEWGIGIGVVLEVVFFAIKMVISLQAEYGWSDHAYGSIFWTIDRLHSAHVVVAILMASAAWVLAARGYFTRERRLGIEVVNIYWQFVAIIWIPVFVVLFLLPRWS